MKRTGAVIRLIVWLLTAAILSSLLIAGLAWDGGFTFSIGGFNYKNADDYIEGGSEVGIPANGIHEIEINWVSGTVKLEPTETDRFIVTEKGAEDSDSTFRYLVKNGKLTIQFAKSRVFGFTRLPKKELTVKIPERYDTITEIELNVVDSDTYLTDISAQEIEFRSVSGDLYAEGVVCSMLDADTVSGNVSFTQGPNFTGSLKQFTMDTVSGDSVIKTQNAPERADCDSISGNVTLAFANCNGFTANYDKVNGSFTSDFPVREISDDKIYGNGDADFSFDTVSGKVRIEKLESAANEPADTGDTSGADDTTDAVDTNSADDTADVGKVKVGKIDIGKINIGKVGIQD